jgi:DNA-binding CsgD family transcriptional regulator
MLLPSRATSGYRSLLLRRLAHPEGPSASTLEAVLDLTPVEARLTSELAAGNELPEIARTLGIGVGTVRNHLKRIFSKTGTRRQAELVSLAWRVSPHLRT